MNTLKKFSFINKKDNTELILINDPPQISIRVNESNVVSFLLTDDNLYEIIRFLQDIKFK